MDEEPLAAWARRRRDGDATATVVNLYELVARRRGLQASQLPADERARLSLLALHVIDPSFSIVADSERAAETIELAPYDPEWPALFEAWRIKVATALGPAARRIDHVGSTSVPGLTAKPIIDIQVSVDDINDEQVYVPPTESMGVQLRNRDAEHRYFRPFAGRPRDVHVHVCNANGIWERRHLLFAAYLREDQAARREYLVAKLVALARWADDRVAYTEAKDDVVRRITEQAEHWALVAGWNP